jgi:hypothetical protein
MAYIAYENLYFNAMLPVPYHPMPAKIRLILIYLRLDFMQDKMKKWKQKN